MRAHAALTMDAELSDIDDEEIPTNEDAILRVGVEPDGSGEVEGGTAGDMGNVVHAGLMSECRSNTLGGSGTGQAAPLTSHGLPSLPSAAGAAAAGLADRTKSSTPSRQAHLSVVRTGDLHLAMANDWAGSLGLAGHGDTVQVAGQRLKRHGGITDLDTGAVVDEARGSGSPLLARNSVVASSMLR